MSKNLLEDAFGAYKPSIDALLAYAKACGLEGEEHTVMAGGIAFHGADLCVLVGGASQAGKTAVSEVVMSMPITRLEPPKEIVNNRHLLFEEGRILTLEFGSKTAIAYTEEKLKQTDSLYVPEYQKLIENGEASRLAQEALKSFGEGRDVYRDVTNVNKGKTDEQILKRSNFWTNIATENPLKIDVETGNRVLPLFVDVSAEQTRRIMKAKAEREFRAGRHPKMLPDDMLAFKHFIKKYRQSKGQQFDNPFSTYITEHYLPAKYIKSRRAIDFYLSFNRAICKWHYLNGNRLVDEGAVLINIEDIYQTEEIYGAQCRFDMLQLDPNSMEIFHIFERFQAGKGDKKKVQVSDDGRNTLDTSTIHKELTAAGFNLKLNVVEQMLDELQECGYLEYSTGTKQRGTRYMLVDVEKPVNSVIDYMAVFEYGCDLMANHAPNISGKWKDSQLKDGQLIAKNPFTGEDVNLTQVTQPRREVKEVAESPITLHKKGNTDLGKFVSEEPKKVKWT